ncbi:MAG: Putative nickel-responsive regulator [Thermodesulfobacterium sp. 37_54]|jgi:CopG family nickel-responsive transcriptional regulator|uniref:Putative nickel-responsive regulator n=1 Tax=Thermodesulfobacterium commune TaxID=1741 RepID=A0A101FIL8_9BACT|nr:nickel-responsive transcriptional regulator NikR [Thermodesulfobacterium thermophilum]KUJ98344.1 MAG: Putative nickel-responsive regulator [Thermodesulfobacterium sp. 37_54]KUK19935.1 MAG: Putative nickel-responsive regulator [Thermodesulfobacterium commune]KUK37697.1 MAG: Putative nickel-responsive regulator [Thermodesulfobacterium commune]HAA83277.1 nickel-responsive transcriptional regulator NikR [Thermodesulfobacterium commune]HBT03189.1 nickel-responsive transcriptional regulator NikR 
MEELARFGISIPKELLKAFDDYIERKHYANRSEAIRDLIRQKLVEEEWKESKEEVVGVITYLYDHHKRELTDKLVDIQHEYYEKIITTQHLHVDHHRCLEIILVRGKANEIKDLADKIQAQKGVLHLNLALTTLGKSIPS